MEEYDVANSFTFNGQNSLDDYEMFFETLPLLPLASFSEVNNPQITCTLGFKTDANQLLRIRRWLAANSGELTFSFDSRIFTVTNIIAQETDKNATFTVIQIIFEVAKECSLTSEPLIFTEGFDSMMIVNPGTFSSFPRLTVYGVGTIQFYLNEELVGTIQSVDGMVTMDSQIQECYVGDILSIQSVKNRDFYGEFIWFEPGLNLFRVESSGGTLESVTIEPRWVI